MTKKKFVYEDNPWLLNGKILTDEDIQGFEAMVYLLIIEDHGLYLGKKNFYSHTKKKGATRKSKGPSDWKKYFSSSEEIKEYVKEQGVDGIQRIVLSLHKTKGDASWCEVKEQFRLDVLHDDRYINKSINSKWHAQPSHIVESRKISDKLQELYRETV